VVPAVAIREFDLAALPPGTKLAIWLELPPSLPPPARIPALVAVGRDEGRTVVAAAGVHGDEFEGIRSVHDVFAALDPARLAGRFVGLPACNPWALAAGTRCTPDAVDGVDLARVFPGDAAGSPTQALAHALLDLVARVAGPDDLFVDLHSGGTRYAYLPMAGFRLIENAARAASEEAARHAGLGRVWAIDAEAGPFNRETAALGIRSVGCEARGQGGLRRGDVALYRLALANLLAHVGLVAGAPRRDGSPARQTTTLLAGAAGLLRTEPRLGTRVDIGDTVAELVDELDCPRECIAAPVAGEVWAVRTFGSLDAGDIVCLIAHE
jgi:N2-acetyl-L-2,4-diaminobutanoate deacetylase